MSMENAASKSRGFRPSASTASRNMPKRLVVKLSDELVVR